MLVFKLTAYFAVIFSFFFLYSVVKNVFVKGFYFLKPCVMIYNFVFVLILYTKWLFSSVQNKLSNYFSCCNSVKNFIAFIGISFWIILWELFFKLSLLIILFSLSNRSLNMMMATRILFCSFTDNNLFIRLLFLCIFVYYSFILIRKHWINEIWYTTKIKYIFYFTFIFSLGHSILKNSLFVYAALTVIFVLR